MGCGFCATATLGLGRHLRRGEIVGQLHARAPQVRESEPLASRPPDEPGASWAWASRSTTSSAWSARIEILTADVGRRLLAPPHHGLDGRPRAARCSGSLADTQVNLAVSLDRDRPRSRAARSCRSRRSTPVEELLATCRALPLPRRKRITFEYVMLAGRERRARRRAPRSRALLRRHPRQGEPHPASTRFPGAALRPQRRVSGGALPGRAPQRRRPRDGAREPRAGHRGGVRPAGRRGRPPDRRERRRRRSALSGIGVVINPNAGSNRRRARSRRVASRTSSATRGSCA